MISSKFNNLPIIKGNIYKDINLGYKGGLVDVYRPILKNGYYYDVVSLYPTIMKNSLMPCGDIIFSDYSNLYNYFGFVLV